MKNKPLFERVVTVTGKAVTNPSNFLVRMGTPINTLIEAAGGIPENTGKIIGGGPMMGKAIPNDDMSILKGNNAILAFDDSFAQINEETACINCGRCVRACPMKLNPALIGRAVETDDLACAARAHVAVCIECGACTFVCPAYRPLTQLCRRAKVALRKKP